MAEKKLTLTDVMRGVRKHGLISRLSDESFTFLIGIILEHNEVGFKDGFDMPNSTAQANGGGNNRQAVKRRREALAKFKIDGKPLLTFKAGNFGKNTCCKYQIDYNLLCSYNGVWSNGNDTLLQKSNGNHNGVHNGNHNGNSTDTVTESVTILRSDQKRGEETNPPNPPNLVTTEEEPENENEGGLSSTGEEKELSEVDRFIVLLKDKFRLPSDPIYGMVNNMIHKYGMESCVAAMENAKPGAKTWGGILSYIEKPAARLSAQSRGVSGEKLDKLEKDYRKLYYDVEESRAAVERDRATMEPNVLAEAEEWLDRNESNLAVARSVIVENGGNIDVRR